MHPICIARRDAIASSYAMSASCPKCREDNLETAQFCTRCHFPLRFVCPACGHVQAKGGTCEACGVDFLKYGMAQVTLAQIRAEREHAKAERRSVVFREVVLAILSGGLSLLKFLRPRR
jgi:zinc ribbon protein